MGRGGGMGRMKETKVRGEWRVREGGIGCTQVQDRWGKKAFSYDALHCVNFGWLKLAKYKEVDVEGCMMLSHLSESVSAPPSRAHFFFLLKRHLSGKSLSSTE